MRSKILIILGILIVLGSFLAYFLLEAAVVRERNTDPVGVLAARVDIPEGTVVKTPEQANDLFQIIEVNREHVVPSSIQVGQVETEERIIMPGIVDRIIRTLFPIERTLTITDTRDVINKRLTRSYKPNEQILTTYLSEEFLDLDKHTRLFAIPVTFIDSVAAEITAGSYVDVWVRFDEEDESDESDVSAFLFTRKILGPHEVIEVKTDEGVTIIGETQGVPDAVVLRLTEQEIISAVSMMHEGTLFFTKHER